MESSKKVSIIVPVYNAGKFINDCIESIIFQSYTELEIILVNDGSTDNSGEICDAYACRDARITVIHQPNAGPSAARNRGINHATGTYIQFVDADDTIAPEMTEKLVNKMTNDTDLVICGYETDSHIFMPHIKGNFTKKALLTHFGSLYKDIIFPSPCIKMYRLERMRMSGLHFEQACTFGEDLLFNLEYLNACRSIYVLQENLYTYRKNCASLTNAYIPNMYEKQKTLHYHVRHFLQTNGCNTDENKVFTETIFANGIIHATTNIFHHKSPISKSERKKQVFILLHDPDVDSQLPYFKDSLQARIFSYFVKRKAYRTAHFFFLLKEFSRRKLGKLFTILQNINKG